MSVKELIVRALLREKSVSRAKLMEIVAGHTDTESIDVCIAELIDKGYRITRDSDTQLTLRDVPLKLYPELVSSGLSGSLIGRKIIHYDQIASTNDVALQLGRGGYPEGTVIVAEQQTQGRGRHARKWESRVGKSILCSILFKPAKLHPNETFYFTMLAGVSVVQALYDSLSLSCSIKWPNDVYLNTKKICGILTEIGGEAKRVDYAVCGIGINVNQEQNEFSPDIPHAGSLVSILGMSIDRLKLFKALLRRLDSNYDLFLRAEFDVIFSEWKHYCNSYGKKIRFEAGTRSGTGTILDITSTGALVVQCDGSGIVELNAGDIYLLEG